MSDERKPVICPWCKNNGIESLMTKQRDSVGMELGDDYYYCPLCHSHSPHIHTVGGEWDMADKECYAAATRRPPNRPMTREQVVAMDPYDAVWMISVNPSPIPMRSVRAAEWVQRQLTDQSGGDWMARKLLFADKPAPADIEAARKEQL